MQKNRDFMRYTYEQPIVANAQNGTTYNANGQLMNFDCPIIPGGFATRVRVYYNVSFTYTPGTGSAAVNAGGVYNLFSDATINFGNKQITMHPYLSKIIAQTRGYNRTYAGQVLGNQSSTVQSSLYSVPALASGSNTWKGYFDIPLTLIHPTSPYGLIPVGGAGTKMTVQLTPVSAFTGADPLLNVIALTGNATITNVTGTVTPVILYRDFRSFATPQALSADLTGLPTAQVIRLRDLTNLAPGSLNYLSITNPYPFNMLASIVIDGQSSATFCSSANIQAYRIDGAENTSSALRVYDNTTNNMLPYYSRHREVYGQDLDDGVLLFHANAENTADADLQDGEMWLNVAATGYPAARLGFQVGTTATGNGISPRVVTMGILMNPIGIN
jgi:hypothetical protein